MDDRYAIKEGSTFICVCDTHDPNYYDPAGFVHEESYCVAYWSGDFDLAEKRWIVTDRQRQAAQKLIKLLNLWHDMDDIPAEQQIVVGECEDGVLWFIYHDGEDWVNMECGDPKMVRWMEVKQ